MSTVSKFHEKHGENVRLLEEDAVAERVKWYKDGAVVFTASPIPKGTVFRVHLLEKTAVDGTPVGRKACIHTRFTPSGLYGKYYAAQLRVLQLMYAC